MKYEQLMSRAGPAAQAVAPTVALDRRNFLKLSAGSGFALGVLPMATRASAQTAPAATGLLPHQSPSAFVSIDTAGIVTVMVNRLDFGQGVITGLPMLVAEKLDADWSSEAPAACKVAGGVVTAGPKRASFGELAADAIKQPVPEKVTLKDPKNCKIIGKRTRRLDGQAKSNGRQQFGIDARAEGMKTVLVLRPPVFGAKLASFDASRAKAVKGVADVLEVNLDRGASGLTVVAQVQRAALMALGTTLPGAAITLKDGVVKQSSYADYTVARMPQMPPIDVHIVPSADPPTGVGEPGLPPLAPAFANAIAKLTGKPLRELPLRLT